MNVWTDPPNDVFLATLAQVLPAFLLAMAADAIAIRFAVNRPALWTQRLLYFNIGQLMVSEFYIVFALAQPPAERVAAWLPLLQLAVALTFSYFILLMRWQGHLAMQSTPAPATVSKKKPRKAGRKR